MEVTLTANVDENRIERDIINGVRRQIGAWLRALRELSQELGVEQKSGNPGPVRQRSAPGEFPARQSGNLLDTAVAHITDGGLGGTFEFPAFYAEILQEKLDRPITLPLALRFFELEATGVLEVKTLADVL